MAKKRGLGKSLDALLSYSSNSHSSKLDSADHQSDENQESLRPIALTQIHRGKYQPRREIQPEALQELADSIKAQGVIQPIIVRPLDQFNDTFEIIAGERRWRAAKLAGLTTIPAIVRDLPDETVMAMALIENIQREDLNPIEEGIALQRLIEEFGMTHQQIAETVGKSRTAITNLLRLLALNDEVKSLLEKKHIEMGHARALLSLPETLQIEAAKTIMSKQLSVRETENLVKQLHTPTQEFSKKPMDPDILRLQESLSSQLKLPVKIQCNARGRGKLIVKYKNLTELDHILACLNTTT